MDTSNSEWERFEELLPWYVNHSLSGEERDWVVDYIARNPEARKVCDNEQEWFTLLQEGLFPFPVEENFQKLMAGLEVESRQRTPPVSWWSRLRAWLVPADTGLRLAIEIVVERPAQAAPGGDDGLAQRIAAFR